MKITLTLFTILSTILISTAVKAQDEGFLSDMYLKGKWNASCAVEIVNNASIKNCELCNFVVDAKDKSKAETKDVELNFQADSLIINQNGNVKTVAYARNKDNHSFSFILNGKQYNFRMFLYNKQRIIEDSDGHILVLTKAI
jgi:hypothetical protein